MLGLGHGHFGGQLVVLKDIEIILSITKRRMLGFPGSGGKVSSNSAGMLGKRLSVERQGRITLRIKEARFTPRCMFKPPFPFSYFLILLLVSNIAALSLSKWGTCTCTT